MNLKWGEIKRTDKRRISHFACISSVIIQGQGKFKHCCMLQQNLSNINVAPFGNLFPKRIRDH